MKILNNVINGMSRHQFTNAHLSYKGRSVIIDYEHCLHAYDSIPENMVPIEMYPYYGDIYISYCKLDAEYHKVDIEDLIRDIDEALEQENNSNPYDDMDEDEYNAFMEQGGDWEG
jgi:hypothetical protein